ncbi:S8 family peptidase [Actinomadura verrucosospora]|uniref:Peptidase S8/S53 subtilisin kexin sedolisin n=1 Tax=Actinomadura verrucosospora TaxID=46165 RepID=A0A7D3W074_ACTVE|nr:S8 family peptidase [Actinomadura verrucosospora]QKG23132.1 peptidase S8/S53 subtilisin kexin sedolisin [Actinomadura verrucosospora]
MRAVHRRLLFAGVVAACVGGAATLPVLADSSPSLVKVTAAEGTPVPGRYIVTMKQGASAASAVTKVKATGAQRFDGVLNGFAAKLTSDQLNKLRRNGQVAAIEHDQVMKAQSTQGSAPWGLDRIDQRKRPLSKTYHYSSLAKNVTAYVIDSGLDTGHSQFGGRAGIAWVAPTFNGNGGDCNGHGTHVAGIIGSNTYGVAKGVKLRALRVLDCNGEGYVSDIISAVNWLRTHAAKPAVANMSIGGAKSTALNTAVTNLSKSGVFVSVAAGNDNKDACKSSPSSAGWVMAVGATTSYDNRATWSNWGKCVDINAPGYDIRSTLPGNKTGLESGTSMASPFVAGTAALYLSTHPKATFPTVQTWLNNNSTKNVLGRMKSQANRLLYKSSL